MSRTTASLSMCLVIVVALAGCVGTEDAPSAGTASQEDLGSGLGGIRGVVTDDGLSPIPGVAVALLGATDDVTSLTDSTGHFTLLNLEPGKHTVAVNKLGYDSAVRIVDVRADEITETQFQLAPIAVRDEPYYIPLIGEGYFACGAYLVLTSWGNLHACVWDEHKPRYIFEADKTNLMGIMQEITWTQSSALTSEQLLVRLQYGSPVCDPFCDEADTFAERTDRSPVRIYTDIEGDLDSYDENPVQMSSLTFPGGDNTPVVVFQQRMTHYVTLFYNAHSSLESFTGIPDQ